MLGKSECFAGPICKNCCRLNSLETVIDEQHKRIASLESKLDEMISRLNMADKEISTTNSLNEKEVWTKVVRKNLEPELKAMNDKVKKVQEKMENRAEEEKSRERKKNNIIIHRMEESKAKTEEDKYRDDKKSIQSLINDVLKVSKAKTEEDKYRDDKKSIQSLINDVLKVPSEDKEIKKVIRLGKIKEGGERPLLIEFREGTLKNQVIENLSNLRHAEEKHKRISVTHDMTIGEREQCKELVKQCKTKQLQDQSGEWIFKVRGPPGDMRIVKLKRKI